MMHAGIFFLRFVALEVLFDAVRFPVWWYGAGLVRAWRWFASTIRFGVDRLALPTQLRHLGTPMFGDYSREGRVISFFVRLFQLLVAFLFLLLWTVWHTLLLLLYLAVLPGAILLAVFLANG